MKFATVDVQY